jgi:hypothetical protein
MKTIMTFEMKRTLKRWTYTTLPFKGKCKIDGETISFRMRLEAVNLHHVPDVLGIEAWCKEAAATPTTVEEFALLASDQFEMQVTVIGKTKTHGTIRVTIS